MADAFLLSAARTPIGKYLGGLADVPAPQLGAVALAEALQRAGVPPRAIDEVIFGNVHPGRRGPEPGPAGGAEGRPARYASPPSPSTRCAAPASRR